MTHETEQYDTPTPATFTDDADRVKQFLEHLHKIGFLREVRSLGNESAFDDFEPVPIDGPPLSQTIIEDRR